MFLTRLLVPIAIAMATACSANLDDGPVRAALADRAGDPAQVDADAPPAPAAPSPEDTPTPAVADEKASRAAALILPGGVTVPVLEDRMDGTYLVQTPCGERAVAPGGEAVSGVDVVLDPGHGGVQPGATGPGGLAEKGPNVSVALLLASALEQRGYTTLLTRTADYQTSLATRGAFAQSLRPRAFVSVHFNSDPDETRTTPGSEVFYQHRSPHSKRLAGLLYEEVYRFLAEHQIAWRSDFDAGVKPRVNDAGDDYYAVLRLADGIPAALTESAFISNAPEEQLIGDPAAQAGLANAMASGIERFLVTNDGGSGYVDPYHRESPVGSSGSDGSCVDPELGLEEVPHDG